MEGEETPGVFTRRQRQFASLGPIACASCANRRPGWFCSLHSSVLADLELISSTISLPPRVALFTEGDQARCLYLLCSGFLKLTAGHLPNRQMIVRVARPGSILGLYATLSSGIYEISAESLTAARVRAVESSRFRAFLQFHREAQARAFQCMCHEYRFALEEASRISLCGTVAARLGRLLLELANQTGDELPDGTLSFPVLLTHDEMASMACTTRETVTRTLGQFRKDGWISIEGYVLRLEHPEHLRALI